MSVIPSNLARVPNMLASQIMLSSINNTQRNLLDTQTQLATGQRVNKPSDDAIAASTISVLDDQIERRDQRLRNMSHAESMLNNVDSALGDASNLVLQAKDVGLSQIGVGSDEQTRENQALVIDSIIQELTRIANRDFQDMHFFGGSDTASEPMQSLLNGLQYTGNNSEMLTDIGLSSNISLTMSGDKAFGSLSERVTGARDLDPALTNNTRISDLNGARGLGVALGPINVDVGGTDLTVDLTDANNIEDVITTLQDEIQTVDPGATVSIAASGNALAITPTTGNITISDPTGGNTAVDLGLAQTFPNGSTTAGSDVDPRITELTPVSALSGVTTPLGMIRLENAGQSRDLDLSGAQTVQDIMNEVRGLDLGIRVEIAESGDRLNFINELSGGDMSIGEVAGGNTATELGVRSLSGETLLSDFNNGQGVEILSGAVDPVTGNPDPAKDLDFNITLKDGQTFDVDLAGSETVQDVIDAINNAASAAGVSVPADFQAELVSDGNGIALTDNTTGTDTTVTSLNGSHAAQNLGIAGSTTSATLNGEDRAKVAVDSVFTHLIDLRDALKANDESGISLATGKLEQDITRLAGARATIGTRTNRVNDAALREEDQKLQDQQLRSEFQDLDYTEAAIRFSVLQQQLQAGLTTASQVSSLSLLDFLR